MLRKLSQTWLPQRQKLLRWSASALVLTIFAFLVWQRVDLTLVGTSLREANLSLVVLAILPVYGLSLVIGSVKWHYLLRMYDIDYPFRSVLHLYLIGMFAGFFVSDSLGAFIKAFYVKNEGYPLGAAAVTIVLDKLTEMIVFLGGGLVALSVTPALARGSARLWVAAAALVTALTAWLVVRYWQFVLIRLRQLFEAYIRHSLQRLPRNHHEYTATSYSIRASDWAWIITLSLASQFLQYLAVYLLMEALGLDLPFGLALAMIITVGLVSMLPISLGGIGTRDAALVFWFRIVDLPVERALALSVLLLVLYLVWRLVGLVAYLFDPLDFDKLRAASSSSN